MQHGFCRTLGRQLPPPIAAGDYPGPAATHFLFKLHSPPPPSKCRAGKVRAASSEAPPTISLRFSPCSLVPFEMLAHTSCALPEVASLGGPGLLGLEGPVIEASSWRLTSTMYSSMPLAFTGRCTLYNRRPGCGRSQLLAGTPEDGRNRMTSQRARPWTSGREQRQGAGGRGHSSTPESHDSGPSLPTLGTLLSVRLALKKLPSNGFLPQKAFEASAPLS